MSRLTPAMLLALLGASAAFAADTGVEQTLRQTEQRLADAVMHNDATTIEQALASDFTFVAPDGTVQDRAGFVSGFRKGDVRISSTVYDDMQVHVYGDAAVVTYHSTDKGMVKDMDISGDYRWTDVFVKQGGSWKIVATQGTQIPPAKPETAPAPQTP